MPVSLALLMAATAALLAISVCAVRWRGKGAAPSTEASELPRAVARPTGTLTAMDAQLLDIPAYAPPEGSLLTAQLEVNQTIRVQTRTATYVLTLRDPVHGLYDAVRTGPKKDGRIVQERFQMHFGGTFVPNQGLIFGAFVLGGNLSYKKNRGNGVESVGPSSPVLRVFFSIPECRQAS